MAALQKMADVWNRDVPFVNISHAATAFIMSPKLQGVARGANWIVRFDKAWLE